MKKIEKDDKEWSSKDTLLRLISDFLEKTNDFDTMFKLLCMFDNIKYFEIEDKDFLDCINTKFDLNYDNVIRLNTNEVLIRNYLSQYIFKFDRLVVNVACKNNFEFDRDKYYSKDEINELISNKIIYPINCKYVALDYVPENYTRNSDEKLNTPYLWKSNHFDKWEDIHEKDNVFYDYFVNKLNSKYSLKWMIDKIKNYLNYLYYDEYIRNIEHYGCINEIYESYFNDIYEVRDKLNELCNNNGETPLELVTTDSLYDYLVSQINVPKKEKYKYVGRNNIISLLKQFEFKDEKESEKYKDIIRKLNDSILSYGLIISYCNINNNDLIEVFVNNNDVESCYKLIMNHSEDFDDISLYKLFKIVLLSGNIEYINNIKNTALGSTLCVEHIDNDDNEVYKLIKK